MKALGAKTVALTADAGARELVVAAATDAAAIKTFFRGLDPVDGDGACRV